MPTKDHEKSRKKKHEKTLYSAFVTSGRLAISVFNPVISKCQRSIFAQKMEPSLFSLSDCIFVLGVSLDGREGTRGNGGGGGGGRTWLEMLRHCV